MGVRVPGRRRDLPGLVFMIFPVITFSYLPQTSAQIYLQCANAARGREQLVLKFGGKFPFVLRCLITKHARA
jgi:hypothetical protein